MKCPTCGKFLKDVTALHTGPDREIKKVFGECKTHGVVEPQDWEWDDFFGSE